MKQEKARHLAALFHHRWTAPILAELHVSGGCKFVTLVNRLEISRDALGNTLRALAKAGWVGRNPGYGHPLRPEYILTRSGSRLGPSCVRVMQTLQRLGIERIGLRKWSLPIVYALTLGETRFSQLRAVWPDLTPRALTMTLKELQGAGVVQRFVADGYPPGTYYTLTARGKRLAASLND